MISFVLVILEQKIRVYILYLIVLLSQNVERATIVVNILRLYMKYLNFDNKYQDILKNHDS